MGRVSLDQLIKIGVLVLVASIAAQTVYLIVTGR